MLQIIEQNKTELINLPDKKFKVMIIKVLTGLEKKVKYSGITSTKR